MSNITSYFEKFAMPASGMNPKGMVCMHVEINGIVIQCMVMWNIGIVAI